MSFLEALHVTDVFHSFTGLLLVPVIVLLVGFVIFSLYSIGSILSELIIERRHYRNVVPSLLAQIADGSPEEFDSIIESSSLLLRQKQALVELVSYLYLPHDARYEVAKRLLLREEAVQRKVLDHTDIAAKVTPMLGLMGTLIPLGPGIVALSTGDTQLLSQSLLIAFDTTIMGLASAVVCFIISRIRRRWYSDYTSGIESVMTTLLEKAEGLDSHEAHHE